MADIDFTKFKAVEWITMIFSTVAIFLSGILFIFSFRNDLFFKLDTLKLIMLSASITCPIWLVNCLTVVLLSNKSLLKGADNNYLHFIGFAGSMFSIPVIYLPIIVHFYYRYPIGLAIGFILFLEAIVFFSVSLYGKLVKSSTQS